MTNRDQLRLFSIVEELILLTLDMAQAEHTREDLYFLSTKMDAFKKELGGPRHEFPKTD